MDQPYVLTTLICITAILITILILFAKLKLAQQQTIQKILDAKGSMTPELMESLKTMSPANDDFRRGILLIAVGLSLGVLLLFIGGKAWALSLLPIVIGCIYLFFWKLNANK
jgi:hypothetical protein